MIIDKHSRILMNQGYTKFNKKKKIPQRTSNLDLYFLYQSLLFHKPDISIKMLLSKKEDFTVFVIT